MPNPLLVVIDMQNGFVNENSEGCIPSVNQCISFAREHNIPVVFTRFINDKNSGWVQWMHWEKLMTSPEIDLHDKVDYQGEPIFDKTLYSAFTKDFEDYITKNQYDTMYFCGIATDGCVMKSAVDAFEKNIHPIVIQDACASHAGQDIHDSAIILLKRYLGIDQIVNLADIPV